MLVDFLEEASLLPPLLPLGDPVADTDPDVEGRPTREDVGPAEDSAVDSGKSTVAIEFSKLSQGEPVTFLPSCATSCADVGSNVSSPCEGERKAFEFINVLK